jgi:ATP-binding cassette subfamily B protein
MDARRRASTPEDSPKLQLPAVNGNLRRVFAYFLPYSGKSGIIIVCILLGSIFGLISPLLIRNIIDQAIPDRDLYLLSILALGMLGASLFSGLISVGQNHLSNLIGQGVMYDVRNQLYTHLQGLHLGFFVNARTGETVSRLNSDVAGIQGVVTGTFVNIISQAITLISTVFMIFYLSWQLAIVSVLILPLFIIPARRVGRIRRTLTTETQQERADLTHILQESLSVGGYVLMKAFGRESSEREKFREKNFSVMKLQIRQALVGRWYFMIVGLFGTLGPALAYWIGGALILREAMTLGTVVAFVAYLARLYGPASSLASVHVEVTTSMALFERIFQYLDLDSEITDSESAVVLRKIQGRIEFRSVSFYYRPGYPILDDVSFTANAGEMVALVGPSGAGKTTLTYLLPRFYDPTTGALFLDGKDLRDLALESLRKQIGVVTQDSFVYHDSVLQNLLYANPLATDEEIESACKDAQFYETVNAMPRGFETIVGENGYRLSGGERQRLAIARVILADTPVVILDEATSSLDSVSEMLIQRALEPIFADRTVIAVAHRLSTIRKAQQILVLDEGKIVEHGTHSELMNNSALYSQLYTTQMA